MNFRVSTPDDLPQIWALCEKYDVGKPSVGICFVAEENGEIRGFVNGGQVGYIESIVSESPTGMAVLFSMLEGALLANTASSILSGVVNPIAGQMLERHGFSEIKDQKFYIKKR